MKPLTKPALDSMTCMEPGCDHSAHDFDMVLKGRCHPNMPARAWYRNGVLTLACAVCNRLTVEVAVGDFALSIATPRDEDRGLPLHACCEKTVWVTYETGYLHVKCATCKSPIAMLPVIDDSRATVRRRNFLNGI